MSVDLDLVATKHIIVCDDDKEIREFLGYMLKHAGYDVLLAASHKELLAYINQSCPDLVLLDIRMPETDGFLSAESLRRQGHRMPIIFMSAHDNTFSRLYSTCVGASGYIKKPFNNDVLLQQIQKLLE